LSVCNNIVDSGIKYACQRGIAILKKDLSICDLTGMDYTKYFCYTAFAKEFADENVCEQIPQTNEKTRYIRNTCFEAVANIAV